MGFVSAKMLKRYLLIFAPCVLDPLALGRGQYGGSGSSEVVKFIRPKVVKVGNRAIFKAAFKNLLSFPVTFTLKRMDMKLYQPATALPKTVTIAGKATAVFVLEYPAAAASERTPAELKLIRHGLRSEPTLNYSYEYRFSGGGGEGSGSYDISQMDDPQPFASLEDSAGGKLIASVSNPKMPRALEVRIDSIIEHGERMISKPMFLTAPAGGKVLIPGVVIAKPANNGIADIQIEYSYRLVPNKTWTKGGPLYQ